MSTSGAIVILAAAAALLWVVAGAWALCWGAWRIVRLLAEDLGGRVSRIDPPA